MHPVFVLVGIAFVVRGIVPRGPHFCKPAHPRICQLAQARQCGLGQGDPRRDGMALKLHRCQPPCFPRAAALQDQPARRAGKVFRNPVLHLGCQPAPVLPGARDPHPHLALVAARRREQCRHAPGLGTVHPFPQRPFADPRPAIPDPVLLCRRSPERAARACDPFGAASIGPMIRCLSTAVTTCRSSGRVFKRSSTDVEGRVSGRPSNARRSGEALSRSSPQTLPEAPPRRPSSDTTGR